MRNTGQRAGAEISQVYVALPAAAGEPPRRLVGYKKVELAPGESRQVDVPVDSLYLSIWDTQKKAWTRLPGEYGVSVGGSSRDLPLTHRVALNAN